MKKMKKILAAILTGGMILSLAACGSGGDGACIFRKNRALAPHERSAVPLGTDHCPVG